MKLFKLINVYPGLPKWAKRGMVVIAEDTAKYFLPADAAIKDEHWNNTIDRPTVQGFPGIWQSVEPYAAYTINAFKDNDGRNRVLGGEGKYWYSKDDCYTLDYALSNGVISVVTYNRPKLDTTFEIGQRVKTGPFYSTIDGFTLRSDGEIEVIVQANNFPGKFAVTLAGIEHAPLPKPKAIAVSMDEVELFDGDLVHVVETANNYQLSKTKITELSRPEIAFKNGYLWFKSEKAAKEFAALNKPVFSYEDIKKLLPGREYGIADTIKKAALAKK